MRKLFTLMLLCIAIWGTAQERKFVIRGEMSSPVLCYSKDMVKEVRLTRLVDGQPVVVATAPVVDNKFVIEGVAPETLELCNITGFDNGSIQVFIEEGEIKVGPFDAAYPVGARHNACTVPRYALQYRAWPPRRQNIRLWDDANGQCPCWSAVYAAFSAPFQTWVP